MSRARMGEARRVQLQRKRLRAAELKAMCTAVDQLARAMKAKLRRKARQGRAGGLDEMNHMAVRQQLHEHFEQFTGHRYVRLFPADSPLLRRLAGPDYRQAIDVANLTMMLWAQTGKQQ
jgi:hypothetical protein